MRRPAFAAGLALALMALFGYGVYAVLGTLQTKVSISTKPTQTQALVDVPGTVVVAAQGSLYSLANLHFTRLATPPGDWVQVAPASGGDLLAVQQSASFSDLYLLSSSGQEIRLLLQESSPVLLDNHWVFYPRLSPNGQTIFYAWDWAQYGDGYNVDFQIQAVPMSNTSASPTIWSYPNYFQGGDVYPIPLANGGLIYAKYAVNTTTGPTNGNTYSQLVYTPSPNANPIYLTTPQQDCSEPALSPSGTEIAMICVNNNLQSSSLQVASWNGTTLGTPVVLSSGPKAASPTWAPNGKGVLFLDTAITDQDPFQLWWVANALSRKPSKPIQVTQNLNLTATSSPVWSA